MSEENRKIGVDYFDKLRKVLQKQKKLIHGLDQNFQFNPKYLKIKRNVPKNNMFKRGGLLDFPFIATKLPAPLKPKKRNVVVANETRKSLDASAHDSLNDRPRRADTYVNLPTEFFTEQHIPRNFSIFEPEVQLTECNNTIATANSAIFKPPVTSTPFNLDENENHFGDVIQDEPDYQLELETSPPIGPSGQDLKKYSNFVDGFSKAAASADQLMFKERHNECNQAKEYLQKIMKYTAPSPSTSVVEAIKKPCPKISPNRKQTTDTSLSVLFASPNIMHKVPVLPDTFFKSPIMSPLCFAQRNKTLSDPFKQLFGEPLQGEQKNNQTFLINTGPTDNQTILDSPLNGSIVFSSLANRQVQNHKKKHRVLPEISPLITTQLNKTPSDPYDFGRQDSLQEEPKNNQTFLKNTERTNSLRIDQMNVSPVISQSIDLTLDQYKDSMMFFSQANQQIENPKKKRRFQDDSFVITEPLDDDNFANHSVVFTPLYDQAHNYTDSSQPDTVDQFFNQTVHSETAVDQTVAQHNRSVYTYFEETFDRNLSGYRKFCGPYSPPDTQLLNTESPEFEYEPRNMLDRKNQFDIKRLLNRNIVYSYGKK